MVETGEPMADVGHHFLEELVSERHLDVDFFRFHVGPRHFFGFQLTRDEDVDDVVAFARVDPKLRLGIATRRRPRRRRMLRITRTDEGEEGRKEGKEDFES